MTIKEKTNRIQWFLDFLNCDFGRIDYSDNLKWMVQLFMMVRFGKPDAPSFMNRKPFLSQEIRSHELIEDAFIQEFTDWTKGDKLGSCQDKLKTFFIRMMDSIESAIKQIDDERQSNLLKKLTDVDLKINKSIQVFSHDMSSTDAFLDSKLQIVVNAPTDEDTLIYHFCQSVNGIPVGAFRQCEEQECNKLYVHISKKEKKFCSQTCATKNANRLKSDKYKSDKKYHENELKAGSKRARKSYVKKVKKEHPKAKPDRRPYKHKD